MNFRIFTCLVFSCFLYSANTCLAQSKEKSGLEDPSPTAKKEKAHFFHKVTHLFHLHLFGKGKKKKEKDWDAVHEIVKTPLGKTENKLKKEYTVLGYHPHYMGKAYESYNYDLLSIIAYFSYELNPHSGHPKTTNYWKTTKLFDYAKDKTKVLLTVNNFGEKDNNIFLKKKKSQKNLFNNLIALISSKNGHGVNIDFEGIGKGNQQHLTDFFKDMRQAFDNNPKSKDFMITMIVPKVDWNKVFDIKALQTYVDLFVLTGYDYYYSGSPHAGPVDPIQSGHLWQPYNLDASINYYLEQGLPAQKFLIGLPYYGYKWHTKSSQLNSKTKGKGTAVLYKHIRKKYGKNFGNAPLEPISHSNYIAEHKIGRHTQLWFDTPQSIGSKYDLVKQKKLGGIGIWALGYDNGYNDYWDVIHDKFGENKAAISPLPNKHAPAIDSEDSATKKVDTTATTATSSDPITTSSASSPNTTNTSASLPSTTPASDSAGIIKTQTPSHSTSKNPTTGIKQKVDTIFSEFSLRSVGASFLGILLLGAFIGILLSLFNNKIRLKLFSTTFKQFAYYLATILIAVLLFSILGIASTHLTTLMIGLLIGTGATLLYHRISINHIKNLP